MKPIIRIGYIVASVFGMLNFSLMSVLAATHFVSPAGGNVSPYTDWSSAATSIQDAVDASASGETVLVSNGVYAAGSRVVTGTLPNRVAITKPITVQSVNGPAVTVIQGSGLTGNNAVRCVYLGTNAALIGFTLTNGATQTTGGGFTDQSGGGIYCQNGAWASNCVISGNSANWYGGGGIGNWGFGNYATNFINCSFSGNYSAYMGGGVALAILYNCRLAGNSAPYGSGGGAENCLLNNCTLANNSAMDNGGGRGNLNHCIISSNTASVDGGGASGILNNCVVTGNSAGENGGGCAGGTLANCTLTGNSAQKSGGGIYNSAADGLIGAITNCIIYFNTAPLGANYYGVPLSYCCTTPNSGGIGNITNDPALINASHISVTSPCVGAGSAVVTSGTDIDGESWANPPSVGCDEIHTGSITGALGVTFGVTSTNVTPGFNVNFTASITGRCTELIWNFGDGTMVSNQSFYITHGFTTPGVYSVGLTAMNFSYPSGITVITNIFVATELHYVNVANSTPAAPFTTWATAATNIQDAVDAVANPGALVIVTNGVYATGGRVLFGAMTNRVAINKPITVTSVNGPSVTIIRGNGPVGTTAVRCVYLGANANLIGFTLTNGATCNNGDYINELSGGGVWCQSQNQCLVSNCWIVRNSASIEGGGAYSGMINHCNLIGNKSYGDGGGEYSASLNHCTLANNSASYQGGGALYGALANCILTGNSASSGGGATACSLYNCTLVGNWATYGGGGSYEGHLINCTLTGNSATLGGGSWQDSLTNCILYFNTASNSPNYLSCTLNYCCATPSTNSGVGNITNPPVFLDPTQGNYRLAPSSPCIDAGQNQAWMFTAADLDGNPRILNGTVDMGAYETPFTLMLKACLQGPYSTNSHSMRGGNWTNTPLTSPYGSDPRTISIIPSNIVDWVLVELRNTNGSVVEAKSAFLNTQGQLVGLDGSAGMTAEVSSGYYSVVLKQRNHVAIMAAQPVAFTNYAVSYDFTTEVSQYAGGSNGAVQLEPGVWGMIAGDADADGLIQMVDGTICTNQLGQTGYNRADFNLDGVVDAADLALWQSNMGLSTGMTNGGETALAWTLNVSPIRKTVLSGTPVTLTASGTSNVVNWALASNPSGATLTPQMANTALYTAGLGSNVVDILEAWDGNLLGRAWMNVISAADVTRVGKAIVIAGQRSADDPVWPTTDYLGSLAYNTLLYRGFAKDNVQYLSPVTNQDVDGNGVLDDIAMTATFTNAAMTFTNWAMNNPGQLFVYLVDHGGTTSDSGYFRLNPSEVLTPASLNQWLDAIQNRYGIDVVVVLDFCESGSFVHSLAHSGPGKRIVISACASNEPTYFVAGGQVSFSDAFFGGLLTGLDVAGAFSLAQSAMSTYQSAQLDANGDGVYTPGTDTALVAGTYVGASFIAGKDVPQVGHVLGDQMLYGATTATLWAYDIASAYPLQRVWCFVVPPSHNPNPTNPVADLPLLDLTYNPATGRYEAQYSGFSEMGPYKLVYYAKDIWESVSQPKQSYVFQNGYQERVILAAGGDTNAATWPAVDNLARLAYHTFLSRRLNAQAIYYLSPLAFEDIDGDGTNNAAGFSTLTNLSYAITNWATGVNKLTVYLVGDGANGTFRLNQSETMAPADLKDWLDAYQASNGEAQVVMDFSGSGTFLPVLKAPSSLMRICVASSQAGKTSLFDNGGVMSFSEFFLNRLFNGDSIGQAFALARDAIKLASGGVRQAALLDDNWDGLSTKADGAQAATHYIGSAFRTGGDAPVIGTPMTNATINLNGWLVLWAQDVTAVAGISNVWCLVTPPDYNGTGDLPQTNLTWNAANSRYEVLYTNFIEPGVYVCTFYAGDNLGLLSSAKQSMMTVINTNLSPLAVGATIGADGSFNVTYQGYAGRNYAFDESTNLINWLPLLTNQIQLDGLLRFSTTNPPARTKAFFRARLVP